MPRCRSVDEVKIYGFCAAGEKDLRSLVKFESFAVKTKFTNNSRQFALKINLRKLRKFVKFAVKKINEQFTAILPFRALSTAEIKSNLAKNVKKTLRQHKPNHRA